MFDHKDHNEDIIDEGALLFSCGFVAVLFALLPTLSVTAIWIG